MYEFLWFVGGALVYRFLAILFALSQSSRVFNNLALEVLTFLATVVEDISFIKSLKYKAMQDSGADGEQIKISKLRDEEFFEIWKKRCIANIHRSVPNYVRLPFQQWEEVVALLNEVYRRPPDEKKEE